MDKTNQMHGESREQQNDTQTSPMQNGNTNDLDSRSHNRDNSGMHAGSTEGSSYRQQPDNKEQYGSDRKQSVRSRMNEESLKQKR